MRAEHPAQRFVQQVSGRMVGGRRRSGSGIDDGMEIGGQIRRQTVDQMDRQIVLLKRIGHGDTLASGLDISLVAGLPSELP